MGRSQWMITAGGAAPWPFNFFHCWERSAPSPWIANGGLPHLDDDISLLVKKTTNDKRKC